MQFRRKHRPSDIVSLKIDITKDKPAIQRFYDCKLQVKVWFIWITFRRYTILVNE